MFANLAPCVPSPIYLSGCIISLLSCWRGEEKVLVLSQPYPIVPTYSIRPHVQSPAQPTATYYLPSLPHTFSVYLCFLLTNCFAIHVPFLKPLMPQAVLAMMDPSLFLFTSPSHKLQSCAFTSVHAPCKFTDV